MRSNWRAATKATTLLAGLVLLSAAFTYYPILLMYVAGFLGLSGTWVAFYIMFKGENNG